MRPFYYAFLALKLELVVVCQFNPVQCWCTYHTVELTVMTPNDRSLQITDGPGPGCTTCCDQCKLLDEQIFIVPPHKDTDAPVWYVPEH